MNTTPPPIPATSERASSSPPPLPASRPKMNLRAMAAVALTLLGLVAVGALGLPLLRTVSNKAVMHANRDQIEFIARLGKLQHPQDAALAKTLCTAKGYQVWTRSAGYVPGAKDGFEFVGFRKSGDLFDVAMVRNTIEGVAKLHIRLVRVGNDLRYEDIYLNEEGGRQIGLWMSDVQEHPVLASIKVLQPEIKAVYGEAKAALKGTAETVHDVATIMSIFKGL